jgi:hypothetical protein
MGYWQALDTPSIAQMAVNLCLYPFEASPYGRHEVKIAEKESHEVVFGITPVVRHDPASPRQALILLSWWTWPLDLLCQGRVIPIST